MSSKGFYLHFLQDQLARKHNSQPCYNMFQCPVSNNRAFQFHTHQYLHIYFLTKHKIFLYDLFQDPFSAYNPKVKLFLNIGYRNHISMQTLCVVFISSWTFLRVNALLRSMSIVNSWPCDITAFKKRLF